MQDEILKACLKKAVGYTDTEETVEYSAEKETKRKTVTRYVPPDLATVKFYIELLNAENDLAKKTAEAGVPKMSDSQLNTEKIRLIKQLQEQE